MNRFDYSRYSKKIALKRATTLSRLLYYVGAVTFYLDYKEWKPHFRVWHPLTLLIYFCIGVTHFFSGCREAFKAMSGLRKAYHGKYADAPKQIVLCGDLVIVPDKVLTLIINHNVKNYTAAKVVNRRTGMIINKGDIVEYRRGDESVLCNATYLFINNGIIMISEVPRDARIGTVICTFDEVIRNCTLCIELTPTTTLS